MGTVRILGAGDNVVDRYLDMGMMFPGGNAVNVAVGARRLGARTAYMGRIGDDAAGRLVRDALVDEGVDLSPASVVRGPNAYADVRLVAGDRVFVGSSDGVSGFAPTTDELRLMGDYDVVHTAYSGSLMPWAARIAEQAKLSYDFGAEYDAQMAATMLPHLYLATISLDSRPRAEAEALVRSLVDAGVRHALVTRGARDAVFGTAEGLHTQPVTAVDVVDTLGAGDAFIAAVLVGLASGAETGEMLERASRTAADVCRHHGAFGHGRATSAGNAAVAGSNGKAGLS